MSFTPRVLSVPKGGTGVATLSDSGVLIGNGTGAVQATTAGTAGQVLTSNGAGVDPSFQALPTFLFETATVTFDYTDLQVAALTNNITIFTPGSTGNFSVLNCQIETVVSGAGTTDLVFSLGYSFSGSEGALIAEYNAQNAPANLANQQNIGFILPSTGATVRLFATSAVDNLSDLTAGEWLVRLAVCRWAT